VAIVRAPKLYEMIDEVGMDDFPTYNLHHNNITTHGMVHVETKNIFPSPFNVQGDCSSDTKCTTSTIKVIFLALIR